MAYALGAPTYSQSQRASVGFDPPSLGGFGSPAPQEDFATVSEFAPAYGDGLPDTGAEVTFGQELLPTDPQPWNGQPMGNPLGGSPFAAPQQPNAVQYAQQQLDAASGRYNAAQGSVGARRQALEAAMRKQQGLQMGQGQVRPVSQQENNIVGLATLLGILGGARNATQVQGGDMNSRNQAYEKDQTKVRSEYMDAWKKLDDMSRDQERLLGLDMRDENVAEGALNKAGAGLATERGKEDARVETARKNKESELAKKVAQDLKVKEYELKVKRHEDTVSKWDTDRSARYEIADMLESGRNLRAQDKDALTRWSRNLSSKTQLAVATIVSQDRANALDAKMVGQELRQWQSGIDRQFKGAKAKFDLAKKAADRAFFAHDAADKAFVAAEADWIKNNRPQSGPYYDKWLGAYLAKDAAQKTLDSASTAYDEASSAVDQAASDLASPPDYPGTPMQGAIPKAQPGAPSRSMDRQGRGYSQPFQGLTSFSPIQSSGQGQGASQPNGRGEIATRMTGLGESLKKSFPGSRFEQYADRNIAGSSTKSTHSFGGSIDAYYGNLPQVKDWALKQPGVEFVIFNRRMWYPNGTSKAYHGQNPHTDHVHIQGDGAQSQIRRRR